jgi:cytochrome c oxidase subunit IV|tara:strand:- start:144 stop:527 length:384 start_codon:yes stop_codon:yes gene_type:complete
MLRDDLDLDHEYSVSANHDDEHGKVLRKKIWKVTAILTAITVLEVVTGGSIKQYYDGVPNESWWMIKWGFILLTLVKAGYIVLSFMHLGDERKNFRYMVLGPYMLFIAYLIFHLLTEASYWGEIIHE